MTIAITIFKEFDGETVLMFSINQTQVGIIHFSPGNMLGFGSNAENNQQEKGKKCFHFLQNKDPGLFAKSWLVQGIREVYVIYVLFRTRFVLPVLFQQKIEEVF